MWRLACTAQSTCRHTISSSIMTYSVHTMPRTHLPCSRPPLHHLFSCSKRNKPLLAVSNSKPPTEKGTSCAFVCRFAQGFYMHHGHTTWGSVFTLPTGCILNFQFFFQRPGRGKKKTDKNPRPRVKALPAARASGTKWLQGDFLERGFHPPVFTRIFKNVHL